MRIPWRFRGFSTICDGGGRALGSLVDREGILVADIALDPAARETSRRPDPSGYWAFEPPGWERVSAFVLETLERAGRFAYGRNRRRHAMALARTAAKKE